jgi:hypothetical protein
VEYELPRLRRFALTIGSILFLFSLAGVKFPPEPQVSILGLQLTIVRRDFVDWGLVLASVYATLHYLYVACLKLIPPWIEREQLHSQFGVDLQGEHPDSFVRRHYPGAPPGTWRKPANPAREPWDRAVLDKNSVTRGMLAWSKVDDLDYLLPVIVNAASLLFLAWTWGTRHA